MTAGGRAQAVVGMAESRLKKAEFCELTFELKPSLVVGPHAKHANDVFLAENLVDEAIVNIDPSRVGSRKISHQFLKRRRVLKRIVSRMAKSSSTFGFSPAALTFLESLSACFEYASSHFTTSTHARSWTENVWSGAEYLHAARTTTANAGGSH